MDGTETLELGRILIDIPVAYKAIRELHIRDWANEYGVLSLTLILGEEAGEDVAERLEGQRVRVLTPEGETVFTGICSGAGTLRGNRYTQLQLEARSLAWLADKTPMDRTFQSGDKTLRQVAETVLAQYGATLLIKRDMPLPQMLTQQGETDWQFLRRIANQCGLLLFTDVRSSGMKIAIGAVPFSVKPLQLTGVYEKKDIGAYLDVKYNTGKDASVYEFLQTGGVTGDITAGSGCHVKGRPADRVVIRSDISSDRGMLYNRVLLSYVDGAVPAMEEAYVGRAGKSGSSYTGVLTGEVLEISGTDIKVKFDGGPGGTRWIPYASVLGNDIYAMPDEKDTVFCYFDNSGEIVALGSRHTDTSRPDFSRPEEPTLTAYNRMIKFKKDGIDMTGNRQEYDGQGGNQVKITFSDTEGIDIAASGDITIGARGVLAIQARETPEGEERPTAWFDEKFSENMENFKNQQKAGSDAYIRDKGSFTPYDPVTDLLSTVGGNFVDGFVDELKSPLHIIESGKALFGLDKKEEEIPKVTFASVEDKRVSAIALESLYLIVGDSGLVIGKDYIMIDAVKFQQSGFICKDGYPEVSESQRTGMDIFMDFVKLAVDVACLFCPAMWGLKLLGAGLSLLKGDYYGAVTGLIPFSSAFSAVSDTMDAIKKTNKAINTICKIMAGAEMIASTIDAGMAIDRIVENFKEKGWGALTDLATWEDMLGVASATQSIYGSAKDLAELSEKPKPNNAPEGDSGKEPGGEDGQDEPKPPSAAGDAEGNKVKTEATESCGDPIDVVSGSQKVEQTELIIRDVTGNFTIKRHYESIYKNSGSLLGERWFLSVGSYLSLQEDRAVILMPNRHLERFARREDGAWENLRGEDDSVTLREEDGCYLMCRRKEQKTYRYDRGGKLVSIRDRNGNTILLKYMGSALMQMDFPSGQCVTFRYEEGKLAGMTDILGRSVQYRYEGELLTQVTYPNGGTISYTYTPEGYLEGITDQNGNPYVRNEYAADGRVTRQFLWGDAEYVILYDDNNRTNTFLNLSNGERLEYHYDSRRLVVKTVYTDGSSREARYDTRENREWEKDRLGNELFRRFGKDSQLLEETLPNGLVTCFAYDGEGRITEKWDNGGRKQQFAYDRHGNPVEIRSRIQEGAEQRVLLAYDGLGRVTEVTDAGGNTTVYAYEGNCPQPSAITTPEGNTVRYAYDRAGRCMEVQDAQGITAYAYNHMDCVTMVTNPLGEVTRYYYDALCNLTKVVRPNQAREGGSQAGTRYCYDAMDALVMTVDPLGNVRATPRDVEGHVLKEIHPNAYDPATGDGEGIAYEYDPEGRRIRICYPDGGVERIRYDAMGHITEKIAPLEYDSRTDSGKGWRYAYDEVGQLTQVTDPEGAVRKRYVYDLQGNIVKIINADGYLLGETDEERPGELYRYNRMGWLTEVRKPVNRGEDGTVYYQLTRYRYDLAGNMTQEIRYRDAQTLEGESGAIHTIRYAYDRDNRRVRVSDSTGACLEYGYDGNNRRTSEKVRLNDATEQTRAYAYDAAGRLTQVRQSADEEGCGHRTAATSYEYDLNGNLVRIRLPYGAEIRRQYDEADRLTAETHVEKSTGIQNTTRFSYDKGGNLTEMTDNRGNTLRIEYDLLDQETRRTEKDGGVTRRTYDRNGRLARLVLPNEYQRLGEQAHGQQYAYDLLGRVAEITRPDGALQARHTYDAGGYLLSTTDACGNGIRFAYDLGGRRICATTAAGSAQQYEYDPFGNITGVTDGESNRTRYELDEWGRVTEVARPDGASEYYRYDYAGNITASVDGEGHTTRYEYGADGHMLRMTDPLGHSEEYHYDAGGRLCRMIDRNGVETTYTYNLYGSPTGRRARALGKPDEPQTLGEPGATSGALRKAELLNSGHLGTILSEAYEYTPEGLLKSAISHGGVPGVSNARTLGMRYNYEYDAMGRLTRKSASGRTLLALSYDLNGNLVSQEDISGKVSQYHYNTLDILQYVNDNNNRLAEYAYYPDGTVKSLKSGSLYTEYAYDADRNLTSLKTMLGGEVLADNRYSYDHNGNRTERRQPGGATRYTYDSVNQLTRIEYPTYTEQLYYDRAGNRSRRITGDMQEEYRYDPANHLTEYTKGGETTTFTYDKAGNLTADNRARYTYDLFNRTEMVETFDGHVQINHYDAEGLRSGIEEDGRLVQFIFRGQEVVTELENEKGMTRYIRGYDLIASDADSARTYYHYASDELGSITHVVAGEDILNRYEYDVWGNLTFCEETVENRFKFNGQQYDPISQQYYLRARYYNPVIGRFTQEDTYRGDGLNLYAYCRNNPVYYADPSGHFTNCEKEAYRQYREEGKTPQEALDALNYERFRKENENKGLSPTNAAARAEVDLEIHKTMQKYQMLLNQIDPNTGGTTAREHGTLVHNDVAKQMEQWVNTQGFNTIDVDVEIYYRNGNVHEGGGGSSRLDLLIHENNSSNNMANPAYYYMGDIKTGSTVTGSTYGQSQMERNQRNVLGYSTGRTNIPGVTHWQFNPGRTTPQQNVF